MKRFVLSLLILVSCLSAFSQKIYFLYLQSENDQPFFVKMNEKIHSSNASGYLIISRLHDSSYVFTIGFPENKFPEQKFAIDIKGKDRGYLLKNFGEKGWGLFDLQTLAIQMALPDKTGRVKTEPRDDISPFTEILAKAANDPSLKERPIAAKMEDKAVEPQSAVLKETISQAPEPPAVKKDSQAVVKKEEPPKTKKEQSPVTNKTEPLPVKQDSLSVAKRDESITKKTEQPVIKQESSSVKETASPKTEEIASASLATSASSTTEYKRSVVTKKSESSTSEGLGLIFIDEFTDGKKDTIRIVIPNPRNSPVQPKEVKEEKKFLDISANDTTKQPVTQPKETVTTRITNANCKTVASETDLSKLQKKMMSEKNDEDMVGEARKLFKSKCFTTGQLKSLSTMFMNDAGKYKFFDAAYSYVSDTENFPLLSSELKDEYYINRFKAMLR